MREALRSKNINNKKYWKSYARSHMGSSYKPLHIYQKAPAQKKVVHVDIFIVATTAHQSVARVFDLCSGMYGALFKREINK
jgi:hypothetical protein